MGLLTLTTVDGRATHVVSYLPSIWLPHNLVELMVGGRIRPLQEASSSSSNHRHGALVDQRRKMRCGPLTCQPHAVVLLLGVFDHCFNIVPGSSMALSPVEEQEMMPRIRYLPSIAQMFVSLGAAVRTPSARQTPQLRLRAGGRIPLVVQGRTIHR